MTICRHETIIQRNETRIMVRTFGNKIEYQLRTEHANNGGRLIQPRNLLDVLKPLSGTPVTIYLLDHDEFHN